MTKCNCAKAKAGEVKSPIAGKSKCSLITLSASKTNMRLRLLADKCQPLPVQRGGLKFKKLFGSYEFDSTRNGPLETVNYQDHLNVILQFV